MENSEKISSTLKLGLLKNKKYTLKPIDCKYKLNQNESPFDLPEDIKNRILEQLRDKHWNIYPDFIPENIYTKVAKALGVDSSNVLIGNGSNEMIFTILAATLERTKKVIIPEPTFTVYKLISSNMNADIKTVYLNSDMSFNIDNIMAEAQHQGSVTILCSPNSPTGSFIEYNDIKKIVLSSGGIVVVDEAYIQFGGESVIDLINQVPNLIVLRTFSKAFGLAGLRIGMMISNRDLISELSKIKLPYNLNIFSLIALDVIFDNIDFVDKHVSSILDEKDFLKEKLSKHKDLYIYPSGTNFFLVKVKDSKWLFNELLKFDILIRDVSSYPMLENHLRISIGERKANEALINALDKIL